MQPRGIPKWHAITTFSQLSHMQLPPPSSQLHEQFNKQKTSKCLQIHVLSTAKNITASTQQTPFFSAGFGPIFSSFFARIWQLLPLDGPSVAPCKPPAAPLFAPPRWLELPTGFGQMHPKETSKACCRVPCGFRRAKKQTDLNLTPKKVSKCLF
jgi:hypothetical protein